MPRINILDKSVYNQISAGEVVENPASIVKELVENSIDAGAQNITVMIEDGGIKQISVTDDGEGMEKEDLEKAIMPHATSKIATTQDLLTISTLGFRGEALASISSVSHMHIKSKHITSDTAYFIKTIGGIEEQGVTALNKGTSITINSLFYNTPARYKFLKSKKSEQSQITNLMANLILANNTISISYYIDNKLMFNSDGKGLSSAIKSIYDKSITDNLLPVSFDKKPYKIGGFIAKPDTAAIKHNRNFQTFIINNRIIGDFSLSAVVQNAYGDRLMKRTFPLFILDIVLPFDMVDVNAHPNKKEVRFSKECKINSAVYNAVKDALEKDSSQIKNDYSFLNDSFSFEKVEKEPPIMDFQKSAKPKSSQKEESSSDEIDKNLNFLSYTSPKIFKNNTRLNDNISSLTPIEQGAKDYKIIGQLFDTYILLQHNEVLYIIDQHAAHERILYDKFIDRIQTKPLDLQPLMIAYIYDAGGDYDYIMQKKDILLDMGFEVEPAGMSLIRVNTVPLQLSDIDLDLFLNDLVQNLRQNISDSQQIRQIIAKKACKNAIKGGKRLEGRDIDYVLDIFFEKDTPLQCPHGRPVICKLSKKDIEKMFRRVL